MQGPPGSGGGSASSIPSSPLIWPPLIAVAIPAVFVALEGRFPVAAFLAFVVGGVLGPVAWLWLRRDKAVAAAVLAIAVGGRSSMSASSASIVPGLTSLRVAERIVAVGRAHVSCADPAFAAAGFPEESLVLIAGRGTLLTDGCGRRRFPQRARLPHRRRRHHADFVLPPAADDLGLDLVERGRVDGVDTRKMRRVDIHLFSVRGIWRLTAVQARFEIGDQVVRVFQPDVQAHQRAFRLPRRSPCGPSGGWARMARLSKPPHEAPMPKGSSPSTNCLACSSLQPLEDEAEQAARRRSCRVSTARGRDRTGAAGRARARLPAAPQARSPPSAPTPDGAQGARPACAGRAGRGRRRRAPTCMPRYRERLLEPRPGGLAGRDRAQHHVGVAAEIFGGGMDGQVDAVVERPEVERRRPGVVEQHGGAVPVRHRRRSPARPASRRSASPALPGRRRACCR